MAVVAPGPEQAVPGASSTAPATVAARVRSRIVFMVLSLYGETARPAHRHAGKRKEESSPAAPKANSYRTRGTAETTSASKPCDSAARAASNS